MKRRAEKMWIVRGLDVGVIYGTNHATRKSAIACFLDEMGETWEEFKREYECVKCTISFD